MNPGALRGPDAFGQMLWDAQFDDYEYQVVERDDRAIDVGPSRMYFTSYMEWPERLKAGVDLARGRVVDIGCGAGRHALYLQGRGVNVLGVDNSPLAVKLCGLRGVIQAELASIHSIVRLRPQRFHTVLLLGNNLGLLGSVNRGRSLLKGLAKATSVDAVIIGENIDPHQTDDAIHLGYHQRNRERGRMPGQVRMRVRHRAMVGEWFDYLFMSVEELEGVLDGTGWELREVLAENAAYVAVIGKESGSRG